MKSCEKIKAEYEVLRLKRDKMKDRFVKALKKVWRDDFPTEMKEDYYSVKSMINNLILGVGYILLFKNVEISQLQMKQYRILAERYRKYNEIDAECRKLYYELNHYE